MSARVDDYELIDRIAVGGMAEIYRARDTRSGEIVVLKRLRTDVAFDPEQHAGFLRELQLAFLCTHKNIIKGYAKGAHNGIDYGVLEYVDGQDLQRVVERAKKLQVTFPIAFSTFIVAEVLEGLHFAWELRDAHGHQLGLVHRDLTPKNVFVRYDGQVRVGDFGSALATLEERAQAVVGTLGYMSPEQARNESLDQRSDVYAAGLLLYELITGVPAYDIEGKKDLAVLKMHQKGQMRAVPVWVPEELRLLIEIACALDPEDRYASARDMRAGLFRSDFPPDPQTELGIATFLRRLFAEEFKASRLPGSPLTF